jgi:hypothetical protein
LEESTPVIAADRQKVEADIGRLMSLTGFDRAALCAVFAERLMKDANKTAPVSPHRDNKSQGYSLTLRPA